MSTRLGVYLHIPFCSSKCTYCHFASGVYPKRLMEPYLKALRREMEHLPRLPLESGTTKESIFDGLVDTVYVGGGTPSLIDEREIGALLDWVQHSFTTAPDLEVTLEVNPGTLTAEKLDCYQTAGVNRISLGVQTFQDRLLKKVGRTHSVEESMSTIELCRRRGVNNLSLDLIAGLPGQTEADWQENLRQAVAICPEHLSLYLLDIHEDARLGRRDGSFNPDLPDEDLVVKFYEQSVSSLESAGWEQYEISNFCKPGRQSRHNLKYWTDQPFIGLGCGAHSYWQGLRWGNERDPYRYLERLEGQGNAIEFRSRLTPRQHLEEVMFLGLRLNAGVDLSRCRQIFGFDLRVRFSQQLIRLDRFQLIQIEGDCLKLTPKGRLFSNEVFVEFMQ